MAESYSSQLLDAMDRVWFHQIILLPEPTSVLSSTNALRSCTSSSSESCQWEGDVLSSSSFSQNDCNNEVEDKRQDDDDDNRLGRERLSRKKLISNKITLQENNLFVAIILTFSIDCNCNKKLSQRMVIRYNIPRCLSL